MKEVSGYNPSKDPRLIDCKTECGNDKCYARRYGLFAEKTCPYFVEPKPITNADRIRAMTDEELAGILAMPSIISPPWCSEKYDCPYADQDPVRCDLCALDWLKAEAKDD